ncbi:MAG: PIN domain-containing protein [Bryobacteraceae bacterium]|nr:PIN domain-containing protein [Bryobacteraceae bacterium]
MRVVVDTGPLVAIFGRDDPYRDACEGALQSIHTPMLTTWAVLTEAAWLLRNEPKAITDIMESFAEGLLAVPHLGDSDIRAVSAILDRYRDLKPQLADATIVHLAERESADAIFTLDRRDFSVYRTTRRREFRIVP